MKFSFLLASSALVLFASPAMADAPTGVESEAIKASLSDCLEPITKDINPVLVAEEKKLPMLSAAESKVLANDSGQAFVIRPGNTVLVTHEAQICSVMISNMDYGVFKTEVDRNFGDNSPFHPINQQMEEDGAVTRDYRATINDKEYFMIINAREKSEEGRVQGMITIGRYSEDSSAD